MNWTEIIVTAITCILGASGILTIYVKHRLDRAEKDAQGQQDFNQQCRKLERKWKSFAGRVFYWLVFSMKKGEFPTNGELNELLKAFSELEESERELKELERDKIAELMNDN